ncbi:MAG: Tol-Pal system beta propeller repeat protein TolB [Pseudomonadota bacterium]
MERYSLYLRSGLDFALKHLMVLVLGWFILFCQFWTAHAQLSVEITEGVFEPIRIAIPEFHSEGEEAARLGRRIIEVIENDLASTGLFRVIPRESHLDVAGPVDRSPGFAVWRPNNITALVQGEIVLHMDGQTDAQDQLEPDLEVKFRLWDALSEKQLSGNLYRTSRESWRRVAHIVADRIYERLTGEIAYFDTRIVYIAESGPADRRVKRLAIMDQDGAGHQFLTDGEDLVLTPRFSPTRQQITYLSYYNDQPKVFLFDLQTGEHREIGTFDNMTFAPRFSPDGKELVMSYAEDGNSDIYIYHLETEQVTRLTYDPAIDTSPSFSPDGSQIVFNSDRGRTPQLYVMNRDGSDIRRISFGRSASGRAYRYSTPVWSPRGDLIAFTRQFSKQFGIGVMRPDGSGERLLSQSYLEEGPSWAPNGRVLLFFREHQTEYGRTTLHSIDLTGHNARQLITPGDASDPAWSPAASIDRNQ